MIFTSPAEQSRQTARYQFEEIHRRGQVAATWAKILRRPNRLARLEDREQGGRILSRSHRGVQTVPISNITGSEGRSADFDQEWRPLNSISCARWTRIAAARERDETLPAVDLIRIGDTHYVRDGHHRISVARSQGQLEIEANVIEWHGNTLESGQPHLSTSSPGLFQSLAENLLRRLSAIGQRLADLPAGLQFSRWRQALAAPDRQSKRTLWNSQ